MSTHKYLLSRDFQKENRIDESKFLSDLSYEINITVPLVSIEINEDEVIFKFENDLSSNEIDLLTRLVNEHDPDDIHFDRLVIINDEKDPGVHGGTTTAREWMIRDLNKIYGSNTKSWITLENNCFSLSKGYYFITGLCPTLNVGKNKIRLFDVTNNKAIFYGTNSTQGKNTLMGYLNVNNNGDKFRIEQCCQKTRLQTGFGVADNFGGPEIYTSITIKKNY